MPGGQAHVFEMDLALSILVHGHSGLDANQLFITRIFQLLERLIRARFTVECRDEHVQSTFTHNSSSANTLIISDWLCRD